MQDNFSREVIKDVVVEIIEISRCTVKEAQQFKEILKKDIEKGFKKIVVDLSKCEFLDSTFLSTLVTALKSLLTSKGNLVLCGINHDVQSLLEMTGTNKVFEIYETRKEAVESYKESKNIDRKK